MSWTRSAKRWPGWALLFIVFAALLAVGGTRDNGPSTPGERAQSIAERVACPQCDGEAAADSRSPSAESLRTEIRRLVDEGQLSDEQILGAVERSFGARVLLVPRASGFDALVWALPVAAFVCAATGLAITFRRWRRESAALVEPTDEDRELVAAALVLDDVDDARPSSSGS
jgi:cytochrome c-type biogenesis protein CcmH